MPDPNDWFKREQFWLAAAVIGAVIVFLGVLVGTLTALFAGGDSSAINDRVDRLYKLGLIGAGFVTFCTVVWRGLIATKQADLQREQIDKLADQINETAERNLSELLQKGAELISDGERKAQVAAGLATLNAVVTAKNPKFAVEAMNLAADYIQDNWNQSDSQMPNHFTAAAGVLEQGEKKGLQAERRLHLHAKPAAEFFPGYWTILYGTKGDTYEGGRVRGVDIDRALAGGARCFFDGTSVLGGKLDTTRRYYNCKFKNVKIEKASFDEFNGNTFEECDFSGAWIDPDYEVPDLRGGKNFFEPSNPPQIDDEIDWPSHLHVGRQDSDPF